MTIAIDDSTPQYSGVPLPPKLVLPDLSFEIELAPVNLGTAPLLPEASKAFAGVLDAWITGERADLSKYLFRISLLKDELFRSYEAIRRKYSRERSEYLRKEGAKNPCGLPGYVARKLLQLTVDERHDLTEAAFKVVSEGEKLSRESLQELLSGSFEAEKIRFDADGRFQEVSLELAVVTVNAALKFATQRIEAYNALVDRIRTRYQEIVTEAKFATQEAELYAEELKAIATAIGNDAILAELPAIDAQIRSVAARMRALQCERDYLQAEVERNAALLELSQAEELVANAKAVTAGFEVGRAAARGALAEVEREKTGLKIDRAHADTAREKAKFDMDRAELALSIADKELSLLSDQLEVLRVQHQGAMTRVRIRLPQIDQENIQAKTASVQQSSQAEIMKNLLVAMRRFELYIINANNLYSSRVPMERASFALQKESLINLASEKSQSIIDAAKMAADSKVQSEFHYYKGDTSNG